MILPFIIAVAAIAADQISKEYIKATMRVGESFNLIPNILNIRYIENPGAAFGILADHRWIFMSLTSFAIVIMFGALIYLGRKSVSKYNRGLNIAIALMLGGGVGNMIDRLFNLSEMPGRQGVNVVVDFLEFEFVDFAIFNFADVFVTIGGFLFCICAIFGKYKFSDPIKAEEYKEVIKAAIELAHMNSKVEREDADGDNRG